MADGQHISSPRRRHHELRRCSRASICHHAGGHDISRWIAEVLGDRELAARIAEAEVVALAGGGPAGVERARHAMLDALEGQLLGRGTDIAPSP